MALDPFASHAVAALKKLGARAVPELIDVVDKRADAREESFAAACARLPEAWRAIALLGFAVAQLEEGSFLGDVLLALGADAAGFMIDALGEIGEPELAAELRGVDDKLDYDADDDA